MSRGGSKITRSDSYEYESVDRIGWLDNFAKKLENSKPEAPKTAVEVARARQQQQPSLLDQISSIIGGPRGYTSVESAVADMQERTGLNAYLRKVKAGEIQNAKTAQTNVEKSQFPQSLQRFNRDIQSNMDSFIRNRIQTHRGQVPVPAIQEDLLSTFRREGVQPQDVNSADVAKYISDLITDEQRAQPSEEINNVNLGRGVGVIDMDDDGSNTDFFKGLLAVTNS